jgi:hypothetical protein
MTEGVERFRVMSRDALEPLGRRWTHVQRVAALASEVGTIFPSTGRGTLVAAAYLHDIGYAPDLAQTGFHPLDGARFVRAKGEEHIAHLVAHHSGARVEAKLRRIEGFESEFPFLDSELDQALTYCDLTTGPDGVRVTLEHRVEEITRRYGPEHVVARSAIACFADFEAAGAEIESRMAMAGIEFSGSLAFPR